MKKIFFPIICLAIAFFIFGFLWKIPEWQVASKISSSNESPTTKELIELENSTRRTWAQILAGVFFLITAYFTWRRVTATERNVLIAQEGQITERFTRAIDQLGDKEHLEVRLGGIYALERISRDSQTDHWTVMEVLTAYVRTNARWKGEGTPPFDITNLPSDIQAILTVLGRRTLAYEEGQDRVLELMNVDLRGFYLPEAHLEKTRFWWTHLEGIYLAYAYLDAADFSNANLEKAILGTANLEGGKFWEANLKKATLDDANLKAAIFNGAKLDNAILQGADLRGAKGLTVEQLSKVKTLYKAKLDPKLLEQIKEKYPHLLEEPKYKE